MLDDLRSYGYQVSPTESLNSVSYKFFNIKRRRIIATPRRVNESREFQCPLTFESGYQSLKSKLMAGADVTPNLSTLLLRDDYEDPLLNDWGIHHFHLGGNVKSGFVERTGPLLFAFVTQSDVYCINILNHGTWTEQELIRIIYRNWPHVISNFKINGIAGSTQPFSNNDIAQLRKAGVQTMVTIGQEVYAPLGGGYSTAGTSLKSTMQSDKQIKLIKWLESHVIERLPQIIEELDKVGLIPTNPPNFKLLIDENGYTAFETGSKATFLLLPHQT